MSEVYKSAMYSFSCFCNSSTDLPDEGLRSRTESARWVHRLYNFAEVSTQILYQFLHSGFASCFEYFSLRYLHDVDNLRVKRITSCDSAHSLSALVFFLALENATCNILVSLTCTAYLFHCFQSRRTKIL